SRTIQYGLYRITDVPAGNWASNGDLLVLADKLAIDVMRHARVLAYKRIRSVENRQPSSVECRHPLARFHEAYAFRVPLPPGDHVTDAAGTGFVHTAPGH